MLGPTRYRYDYQYQEFVTLRDGTPVRLRLLRPSDRMLLLDGFERLSPQSRYQRFLSAKPSLNDDEVGRLVDMDNENHLAIAAVIERDDGRECGIGGARFIRMHHRPDMADVAITVIDEVQQRGLGRILLDHLFAAARERGYSWLHFAVLSENRPMLRLLRSMAPGSREQVDSGVTTIELPLDRSFQQPLEHSHRPYHLQAV
ncbi:MAG: GNAT family N-acetyltransferase [Myxococcota bacterium]